MKHWKWYSAQSEAQSETPTFVIVWQSNEWVRTVLRRDNHENLANDPQKKANGRTGTELAPRGRDFLPTDRSDGEWSVFFEKTIRQDGTGLSQLVC